MSLPGQLREVHLYDSSNMAVLRYAAKHTGGYYVQCVIDPEAMAERRFRLCKYGVLRKVIGQRPGIHRNHVGERSDSVRARVLSMGRVQVGNVVQNEPFVAAEVAAAPVEYLDYLPKESSNITDLVALYRRCEELRVALGEDALKGTRFEDLSDLPPDEASPSAAPPSKSEAADEAAERPMTPEELRAMVQKRVAEAAKDGLTGPKGLEGLSRMLNPEAPLLKQPEAAAAADTPVAGADKDKEEGGLEWIAERVFREVAVDGRRTKPGMEGGIGATAPFLLPSPYAEREALLVLAALRYLDPEQRLDALSQVGVRALLALVQPLNPKP